VSGIFNNWLLHPEGANIVWVFAAKKDASGKVVESAVGDCRCVVSLNDHRARGRLPVENASRHFSASTVSLTVTSRTRHLLSRFRRPTMSAPLEHISRWKRPIASKTSMLQISTSSWSPSLFSSTILLPDSHRLMVPH
jgi:hypothetical protein